jgi:hypothetical protein
MIAFTAVGDRGDLRIVRAREHLRRDSEIQKPQSSRPYGTFTTPQIGEIRSPVSKRRAFEVPEELGQYGDGGFTGLVVSAGGGVLLEAFHAICILYRRLVKEHEIILTQKHSKLGVYSQDQGNQNENFGYSERLCQYAVHPV